MEEEKEQYNMEWERKDEEAREWGMRRIVERVLERRVRIEKIINRGGGEGL